MGTTQVDLVPLNPKRLSLTIFNTHATAILYFKEGSEVSSSNGIPIYPKGNVGITRREDGLFVTERFVIISDTASTSARIVEGLEL